MTWNDPNPLANPLTQLAQRAVQRHKITYIKNPKNLQVPNQDVPMYGTPEWELRYNQQKKLEVPNQDIPLGDQMQGNGFLPGSDRLFRLADGTILDYKSGRVVRLPNCKNPEYCGDPNKTISYDKKDSWCDVGMQSIDNLISRINDRNGLSPIDSLNTQIDPRSAQYWLKAQEEAEKMKDNMTPEQLAMINAFEQHFPKSKLIEESQKQT